jgi:hypothetical protein
MILANVIIIRIDLEGKLSYYGRLRHIAVIKDEETLFIKIANGDDPYSVDLERKLRKLEPFQLGDIVDVEIEAVNWVKNKQSGITYWFRAIRKAGDVES